MLFGAIGHYCMLLDVVECFGFVGHVTRTKSVRQSPTKHSGAHPQPQFNWACTRTWTHRNGCTLWAHQHLQFGWVCGVCLTTIAAIETAQHPTTANNSQHHPTTSNNIQQYMYAHGMSRTTSIAIQSNAIQWHSTPSNIQ